MKTGTSTAAVLCALAAVSVAGWAASRSPVPPVRRAIQTTLTTSPPPACKAGQLGLAYFGGQAVGAGNYGDIVIWDRSGADCSLTSPILASGLDRAGRPVTGTLRYPVQAPAQLTAHGIDPGTHLQFSAGEAVVTLIVSAAYLHDRRSGNRPCTAAHQLEPVSWRLKLASGGPLTVLNMDPLDVGAHGHGMPVDHGLLTCRGQLDTPKPAAVAS